MDNRPYSPIHILIQNYRSQIALEREKALKAALAAEVYEKVACDIEDALRKLVDAPSE